MRATGGCCPCPEQSAALRGLWRVSVFDVVDDTYDWSCMQVGFSRVAEPAPHGYRDTCRQVHDVKRTS